VGVLESFNGHLAISRHKSQTTSWFLSLRLSDVLGNVSIVFVEGITLLCPNTEPQLVRDCTYCVVCPGEIQLIPPLTTPLSNLNLTMAFLYEEKNSKSAELIIRLQREDLKALAPDDEDINLALNLQLEELSIVETYIADHKLGFDILRERFLDEEELKRTLELAILRHEARAALLTCTGCESLFTRYQSFKAPCDRHYYCRECLANFFEYTIGDESLYPPKCCDREIIFDNVKTLLDDKLVARYADKKIEYDTKPDKRTYCCGANCKTFIPETGIQDEVATCPDCGKRTCTICKEAAHRGDCPKDEDTQSLLELADNEGWQRCYNTKCHRVIALTTGCNHIT